MFHHQRQQRQHFHRLGGCSNHDDYDNDDDDDDHHHNNTDDCRRRRSSRMPLLLQQQQRQQQKSKGIFSMMSFSRNNGFVAVKKEIKPTKQTIISTPTTTITKHYYCSTRKRLVVVVVGCCCICLGTGLWIFWLWMQPRQIPTNLLSLPHLQENKSIKATTTIDKAAAAATTTSSFQHLSFLLDNFVVNQSLSSSSATTTKSWIDPRSDSIPLVLSSSATTDVSSVASPVALDLLLVVTAFMQPLDEVWMMQKPLPSRRRQQQQNNNDLKAVLFPNVTCNYDRVAHFPIDEYPVDINNSDPFLPWIHDYFPTHNINRGKWYIQFVAQNHRNCNTGKHHEHTTMKYWQAQISLFQPIPVDVVVDYDDLVDASVNGTINGNQTDNDDKAATRRRRTTLFRLGLSPDTATYPETRFMCRFHNHHRLQEAITFSEFNFNYEHVTWRRAHKTMLSPRQIYLSQLLFSCPVPDVFQLDLQLGRHGMYQNGIWKSQLWLDLIPLRTPPRVGEFLFTERHVGPQHLQEIRVFDPIQAWGTNHVLPEITDLGRWANLPICMPPPKMVVDNNQHAATTTTTKRRHNSMLLSRQSGNTNTNDNHSQEKMFRLVACIWTAASYNRKGTTIDLTDGAQRLREWIVFHLMVGFDHLFVYDNTPSQGQIPSPILAVAMEFRGNVTYHAWPCKICNNNEPIDDNPGEWSSQHAAEWSCRERYGPMTEWMAFVDTDEYLVPLVVKPIPNNNDATNIQNRSIPSWHAVLDEIDINKTRVLKLRSSSGKPRRYLMEMLADQSTCQEIPRHIIGTMFENLTRQPCMRPLANESILKVYNCDGVKPPRPKSLTRAMKQIYRPDYVLSHYVHYSIVTKDVVQLYADHLHHHQQVTNGSVTATKYVRHHRKHLLSKELFLDEQTQGILIHARSVLPQDTMYRAHTCHSNSTLNCLIGYPCTDLPSESSGTMLNTNLHNNTNTMDQEYCNYWPHKPL